MTIKTAAVRKWAAVDFISKYEYTIMDLIWITIDFMVGIELWLRKSNKNNTEIPVFPC